MNGEKKVLGCIAVFVTLPLAFYDAFVYHLLWRWFVVPLGAPEIGMAHAYALAMFLSAATWRFIPQPEVTPESVANRIVENLIVTTMALLVGLGLS